MFKKSLFSLLSTVSLLGTQTAYAVPDSSISRDEVDPTSLSNSVKPAKKVCQLAQAAQEANPQAAEQDQIEGTVYGVVGDVVMLELATGETKHVSLTHRERGDIGQIVGRRVVITPIFCNRIRLSPPPVVIPQAIEVPKIESRPQEETIPTPAPAPEVEVQPAPVPAPVPAPEPIPQTW